MNCSTFHRKINDFLEDDCLIDFKNSMEEHRDNCESCRTFYEEELEMDRDFENFFSVKDMEFKSSRAEIINAINEDQYKNNYLIQIYTHFNKYKKKYIALAAIFVMVFLVTTNISKLFQVDKINFAFGGFGNSKGTSNSTATASVKSASLHDKSIDLNNITFEKLTLTGDEKIIPRDTWKNSSDGKYSSCVGGKNIYVKENDTGKLWSFTISDNLNQKNVPMFLDWSQNKETLMVIIGKTTGAIAEGGDIYALNLDSAIAKLIYTPAELEKVKSFKSLNGGLNAELIVYEDSSFVKYHMENIKISPESINNMLINMSTLSKEAGIVFEYQENINNNRLEAAMNLISKKHIDSKAFNYNNWLYDIDNMNVVSLKKISSNYTIDQVTKASFQHEAFSAEVYYALKKDENTSIKNGKNSIVIILVKDNADASWKIGEMQIIN